MVPSIGSSETSGGKAPAGFPDTLYIDADHLKKLETPHGIKNYVTPEMDKATKTRPALDLLQEYLDKVEDIIKQTEKP